MSREGDGGGGNVQGEIGEQPGGETRWAHPWGGFVPKTPLEGVFGWFGGDGWQGDRDTGMGRERNKRRSL